MSCHGAQAPLHTHFANEEMIAVTMTNVGDTAAFEARQKDVDIGQSRLSGCTRHGAGHHRWTDLAGLRGVAEDSRRHLPTPDQDGRRALTFITPQSAWLPTGFQAHRQGWPARAGPFRDCRPLPTTPSMELRRTK